MYRILQFANKIQPRKAWHVSLDLVATSHQVHGLFSARERRREMREQVWTVDKRFHAFDLLPKRLGMRRHQQVLRSRSRLSAAWQRVSTASHKRQLASSLGALQFEHCGAQERQNDHTELGQQLQQEQADAVCGRGQVVPQLAHFLVHD